MLNLVDRLIAKVLDKEWGKPSPPFPPKPDFFFTVPNDEWRKKVGQGSNMRLNIYLYEMRESREFRRSAPDDIGQADRSVVQSQPPAYFDCHYLLSAWSPQEDVEMTTPVLDEHATLSEAMRVLLRNPDVVPERFQITDGVVFNKAHVYFTVAPPEPPRVLNDFWSTMKQPWRPAVMLVVTAPLDLLQDLETFPIVTTLVQQTAFKEGVPLDEVFTIGGFVVRSDTGAAIANGKVERLQTGEIVDTDAQGRYLFAGLRRGVSRFRATAPGLQTLEQNINVPVDPPDTHVFKLAP